MYVEDMMWGNVNTCLNGRHNKSSHCQNISRILDFGGWHLWSVVTVFVYANTNVILNVNSLWLLLVHVQNIHLAFRN